MLASALLTAATVFVYAHLNDLHVDASGKSEFGFVISLLLVCLGLPFFQWRSLGYVQFVASILLTVGFILSFLWMSVLSFDIWRTIT